MDNTEKRKGIAFWRKSTGNYCSHYLGLTKPDREWLIKELQEERPVRMILFAQTEGGQHNPDYVLKFFKPEEQEPPRPSDPDAI